MKNIWKNYKTTIVLIFSLIIGAIAGLIFGEKTLIVKPIGTLFMNLLLVIIVPLIFLTISTSIAAIKQPKRLGKVLRSIVITFVITSLVACAVGLVSTSSVKLVNSGDKEAIMEQFYSEEEAEEEVAEIEADDRNFLERTVDALTVDDLSGVLTRDNVLAVVVMSILVGLAVSKSGKDGEKLEEVLQSANKVVLKLVDLIFVIAPIGLGCYFAALVGTFGSEIAIGFGKTFIVYTIVSILFYLIVYSVYAFIAGGKEGVKVFWKNILPATATSLATCSSAASIPINVKCSKQMGVSEDIAETIIPLGTTFHKDGSIIGSVFKIMFLVYLLGSDASLLQIIGVALVANVLVAAVPVGGGTISEMLIITAMGFPATALPILTIIATIIDPQATLLNVTGDTACSMITSRMVDGKDWMHKKADKNEEKETKKRTK